MIRPLRQRHRRMVIALGVFLPVAFAAGVALRRPAPVQTPPANLAGETSHFENVVWDRSDLWPQNTIRTRLLSDRAASPHFAVELSAAQDIVKPDVLVYWAPGSPKIETSLPDNAALLGVFVQATPTALPLPKEAVSKSGVFVLYSLADHEIVAVSKSAGAGKP